jgi:hypothetical protein
LEGVARPAIAAIPELGFCSETNRADVHPIFERVVEGAVLGIAGTSGKALEADHRKRIRTGDWIIVDDGIEHQMFWPDQQPFLPRAILADAVGSGEHHAASHGEAGVTGVLNNTHALWQSGSGAPPIAVVRSSI